MLKVIGRKDNGDLAIQLSETRKGNVCLDATLFEKVWRMPEQDPHELTLHETDSKVIIKPWIGLVVQIDGELYRLVRVIRAKKEGVEFAETARAREIMEEHGFEYAGIFTPSKKWVENMEIVWAGENYV